MQVILGSSSVARRKIFTEMGYNFTLMVYSCQKKKKKILSCFLLFLYQEMKCFYYCCLVGGYRWESHQEGEAGGIGNGYCRGEGTGLVHCLKVG